MSTGQNDINSAERAVVQHEQYLLWNDSAPAGKERKHSSSQHKKTKLDGAHTTHNMVRNTTILHDPKGYIHSALIKNSLPSVSFSNTNIASQQQQGRSSNFQSEAPAPASTQEMEMAKPTGSRTTASVTMVKVRATSTKDRHSKVKTAKGLRDRRVRLSAPTAVRFFDVQDRLGYDQPSKAMDWLIKKAQAAIMDLDPVKPIALVGNKSSHDLGAVIEEINSCQDADEQCEKKDQKSNRSITTSSPLSSAQAISRARARDRAKEKSNGDNMVLTTALMSALPPGVTSLAISMSPETRLSQFLQPSSEPTASHLIHPLQPYNFSNAILPKSATSHIMRPPPTHGLHILPEPNTSFLFHEHPATLSYDTNTPISLGGTLQSIFIDSVTSPVPSMQPYNMRGLHSSPYEATGAGGNQSTGMLESRVDPSIPLSNRNKEYPKMYLTPR